MLPSSVPPVARMLLAFASLAAVTTADLGCGRTPDLQPRTPLGNLPALDLLPIFTQTVNNDIDIVFMIDNSGSMTEEQDNLRRNFPAFTRVLKNLPQGLPNLHLAVVSSDLGAGPFDKVDNCHRKGDGGRFQNAARGGNCVGPRGSFISAVGPDRNFDGDIDQVFSCIAPLGTKGCGFEHQLQSVRAALDPELMPAENAGFLRDDAVLAIVLLTDEDDCSAPANTTLFDPAQESISDPLGPLDSFRCNEFGHLCAGKRPPRTDASELKDCHSAEDGRLVKISELVTFFKGLKANPNDVIVAVVTGPTAPYSVKTKATRTTKGIELQPKISPSCMSANGSASPAVRLHDFVDAFGANGTFLSICADDFTPVMDHIGHEVARRASLECLAAPVADVDAGTPGIQGHCQVFDEIPAGGATLRALIPQCGAGVAAPCWHVDPSPTCEKSGVQMVVDRGGIAPEPGTRLNVACETCDQPGDPRCAPHGT